MSEHNEGMPFVPEEDLNLHENFQPIIAENGLIRPTQPKEVPQHITTSPDTTFTRIDTIQDLVQIRHAEEESKAAKTPQPKEVPPSTPAAPLPSPVAHTQTVPAEDFATPAAKPPKPQTHQAPQSAGPSQDTTALPEIQVIQPALKTRRAKVHKSKQERKLATKAAATIRKFVKKPVKLLPQHAPTTAPKPAQEVPPKTAVTPPTAQPTPTPKKHRRWPWVLAVLCFLFLGTVSGVVPVEKIPFLRNIAYAMGFSKDDTARMSFLRALLTWTDKTAGRPALQGENGRTSSWWARLWGIEPPLGGDSDDLDSIYGRAQREGGQTRLLDINMLNTMQRKKGLKPDEVRSSIAPIPGRETEVDPTVLKDDNANVQTEANRKTGDVYFGSDVNSVMRNFQDGYDSVNAFKKVKGLDIAKIESSDWLQNMVTKMMKADAGIGGTNKELGGMQVNWGSDVKEVGKNKEHRDLYHAWITSRMTKYTPNLMLKKALADTGFMGAALPSVATNMVGFGGIQIDTSALQEDQESWQEYLEFEKQCKAAIAKNSDKIDAAVTNFNNIVNNESSLGYPTNCYEALQYESLPSGFSANVGKIQQSCKDLESSYEALERDCRMKISHSNIVCDTIEGNYEDKFAQFKQECQTMYNELKGAWEARWSQAHQGQTPPSNAYNDAEDGWKKDGQSENMLEISIVGGEGNTMLSTIKQNGGQFATWVRATCKTDDNGNTTCEPEPGDVDKVKYTIDYNVLKVNGK